jgi:TolA-binding protein
MNKVAKYAVAGAVAMVMFSTMPALADDAPAAPPSDKPQVSIAAGKDLQAAQKALTARRYDEVLTELDKVKANPKKNAYDEFLMNEFYFTAYAAMKKYQEAEGPLEAAMASKYMPPGELKGRLAQAATMSYQMQNYDKTIDFGTRAIKDGSSVAQMQTIVAQSYYLKNDFKDTDKFVRALVDDQVKAGQAPTEEMLQLGLSSATQRNDDAAKSHWFELLVVYHPKPEYWQNLLESMFRAKLSDQQLLQVYRLAGDVGALKKGSDYAEMAQLALDQGSPGEAVTTLSKGFAANVFTDQADKNRNTHLLDSAKKQAATDQPTLPKTEADGAAAPTGDKLASAGVAYFGYGDYAKASKDLEAGLAKGVSKDTTGARLLLGISQFKAGDKDSAVKTFRSVKGDPTEERLASLWILRTKSSS